MTEQEFEIQLLSIILKYNDKQISSDDFVKKIQDLQREFDKIEYKRIDDFQDEELGWAKYWIEELDYYGLEDVMKNRFNFFEFLEKRYK